MSDSGLGERRERNEKPILTIHKNVKCKHPLWDLLRLNVLAEPTGKQERYT